MAQTFADGTILCVGLTCVDLVFVCPAYPIEDSDQHVESQMWQRGGNASNSCTVLSMLGADCECLTTLARGPELVFLEGDMKSHNIKYHHTHIYDNCTAPISTVIVNKQNGSRTILHNNRSLPEVSLDDFKALNLEENYKWIHFEGRPNISEIKGMLDTIDQYNQMQTDTTKRIKTSVELEKKRMVGSGLEACADFVFISKDYAQKCGYKDMKEAVQNTAKTCRKGGTVICPWGEHGAAAYSPDGSLHCCKAFPPEQLVDTLGAGDSFIAATILSLDRGQAVEKAVEFGCRLAGAKCGLQGYGGLRDWYAQYKCN